MTIEYILQILRDAEKDNLRRYGTIYDLNEELAKAERRAKRRIQRLKSRAQYELGEMDKAKVAATSGYMNRFISGFKKIKNVQLADCRGLPDIDQFLGEDFEVRDMITKADRIANLSNLGAAAYSSMNLGYGILETYITLPDITINNYKVKGGDTKYIHGLIKEIEAYRQEIRHICEKLETIALRAREEGDALNDLADFFDDGISSLEEILSRSGKNWNLYSEAQKMQIGRAVQVAQLIMSLFPHLLDDDGNVLPESYKAIITAQAALASRDA